MVLPSISQAQKLPAHLAKFGNLGLSLNESVIGGMSQGGWHPSIGIKQAKWRIREGEYEELVNAFTLDVIIVNANKYLSKVFYAGAYAGEEGKAPDCFSDNGIGPSARSSQPQSANCALCPNNVWGSKMSPSGAKIKACSDYKKLAVVLADDPSRNVYELRIPGASLKDLNTIMTKMIKSQVPIPAVVFQLSFDAAVDYPKVLFKPMGYVSESQAAFVEPWLNSEEAKEAVGENDTVIFDNQVSQQAYNVLPTQAAVAPSHVKAPGPIKEDPMAFLETPKAEATAKPRGRGRPPGSTATVGRPAPEPSSQLGLDMPGVQAAAQSVSIKPQLTDKDMDDLLKGIFND